MANVVLLAGTVGFASAYFYLIFATIHVRAFGDPVGPRMFPILLGCALVLSALMLAYEIWVKPKTDEDTPAQPVDRRGLMIIAGVTVLTFVYFLAFEPLGYVLSSFVYLMVLTAYFHPGKHVFNLVTSLVFSLGTYLLFVKALQVSLPSGVLPF